MLICFCYHQQLLESLAFSKYILLILESLKDFFSKLHTGLDRVMNLPEERHFHFQTLPTYLSSSYSWNCLGVLHLKVNKYCTMHILVLSLSRSFLPLYLASLYLASLLYSEVVIPFSIAKWLWQGLKPSRPNMYAFTLYSLLLSCGFPCLLDL